jgi:hypothetical protein
VFVKNRPKGSLANLLSKFTRTFLSGKKSSPKILPTFVIFTKLPKVNNRPMCEISSNLVTLVMNSPFDAFLVKLCFRKNELKGGK